MGLQGSNEFANDESCPKESSEGIFFGCRAAMRDTLCVIPDCIHKREQRISESTFAKDSASDVF
jgi:hypothetical protein